MPHEAHQRERDQAGNDACSDVVEHDATGQMERIGSVLRVFERPNRPRLLGVQDPEQHKSHDQRPDAMLMTPVPDDRRRTEHASDLIDVGFVEITDHELAVVTNPRTAPTQHERFAGTNRPEHPDEHDDRGRQKDIAGMPRRLVPHEPQEAQRHQRSHQTTTLALEARMNPTRDEASEEGRREAQAEPAPPTFVATIELRHGSPFVCQVEAAQEQDI